MQESTSLPSPDTYVDNSINQPKDRENLFITCTICHAVYTPSPNQPQLAHASHVLLESAFMGMCHFCFRCRRPSCPFCWDMVHGICGSCVLETGLPFRSDVPPLVGTWLPPIRQGQPATNNGAAYPLVCIQPGRLERQALQYGPVHPPINMPPPRVAQPVEGAFAGSGAAMPPSQVPSVQSPMTTMPTGVATNAIVPPMAAMPTVPVTPAPATVSQGKKEKMFGRSHAAKRKQEEEDHLAPYYIYIDDSADEEVVGEQKNQAIDTDVTPRIRLRRRVEYAFTMFLLIVVALLMIVIIVAAFSAAANSYIAQVVHIDIRAEITYLWQLLTGLFSQH